MAERGSPDFIVGVDGMAALIRAKDWSRTPLGPIESWPQSLRTTVSLCLASNFPIDIIWGPENTQIYNDGYRVVCGDAHPTSLGQGFHVTWESAWPEIGGPFALACAGQTSFIENQRIFLTRNGYREETFFTFSLSPIRDESGGIGGVFHPVVETTATMLAERRMRALRDLTAALAAASDVADLARRAVATLARFQFDVPFLLVYAQHEAGTHYDLAHAQGLTAGTAASPATLAPGASAPWPISEVEGAWPMVEVGGLASGFQGTACGPYEEPPDRAFVVPLGLEGARPSLILILGVSPRLPLDDDYRGFFDLVASAMSAAFTTVRAREEERRQAEALAALDRSKTTFFSNVSHEFRTPLTLLLGPLEELLARSERWPEDQREPVLVAYRNGRRLLKLLNSLLDFSRIEAGRTLAHFEPTDLVGYTTELASNFRSVCAAAGLRLVIDAPPLPEPVYLDREIWEKVILNLLSNAFKFTFEGEIRVTVRAVPGERAAEVTVSDTGTGIPRHELPRLFERFHRVEGAKGRSFEGSGIGLALVQELVGLQGGTISVASEPGLGSAFTVTLPLGTTHLPLDQVVPTTASTSTASRANDFVAEALSWLPEADPGAPTPGPRTDNATSDREAIGRVLLADDNADMRGYVGRLLAAEGYTVEAVTNGDAALAAVRHTPPDLILSDVMMPGLDGFGLLRALRADPATQHIPIILLSARAGEEARIGGLEAGADDYLTKPFAAGELVARVSANLRLARDRREAALRASEARFRTALEIETVGAIFFDMEGKLLDANDAFLRMSGYSREDLLAGRLTWQRLTPPEWMEDSFRAFAELKARGQTTPYEKEYQRLDGTRWWALFAAKLLPDGTGFEFVLDITDRKLVEADLRKSESRLQVLVAELQHRTRNLMGVVRSTATRTLRTSLDLADFDTRFHSRIDALARVQGLLSELDQRHRVTFGELLRTELDAMGTQGGTVTLEGPADVRLRSGTVQLLAMALHELATNALKYGALGQPGARLTVRWRLRGRGDDGRPWLHIEWRETGVTMPQPGLAPERRGQGRELIERALSYQLAAETEFELTPDGVRCTIALPVSSTDGQDATAA